MKILAAVLLTAGLVLLYALAHRANKNTPVPAGCENLKPDCRGCGITDCAVRKEEGGTEK